MPKFASVLLLALASCFSVCCFPAKSPTIDRISSGSVALVFANESGSIHPYCSGQFVRPDAILTASHCISGLEENTEADDEGVVIHFVIRDDQPKEVSSEPFGQHTARVSKCDRDVDLCLLKVDQPRTFPHTYSTIAADRPVIGQKVLSYSTPRGLWFSYAEGVVAALRPDVSSKSNFTGQFIQVNVPGDFFGSSGSSIFNESGEIVGVISMAPPVPTVMLMVDTMEIQKFLKQKD